MQDLLRDIRRSCSCQNQMEILELKEVPFSALATESTGREGGGARRAGGAEEQEQEGNKYNF